MSDHDLDAVIAYLHTLKPIKNTVPDPVYRMPQGHPIPPGGDKKFSEPTLADKLNKGFYLATIAHCMESHRLGRRAATSLTGSERVASRSQDSGVFRCRATSPQARRKASAPGPTMRSSVRSPKASAATAASLSHRWATTTTRRSLQTISAQSSPICAPYPPKSDAGERERVRAGPAHR